jgi:hypothetical protein
MDDRHAISSGSVQATTKNQFLAVEIKDFSPNQKHIHISWVLTAI